MLLVSQPPSNSKMPPWVPNDCMLVFLSVTIRLVVCTLHFRLTIVIKSKGVK
jgi:hypothetical protein